MSFLDKLLGRDKKKPEPQVVVNHEEQYKTPKAAEAPAPEPAKQDVDTV